MSEKWRDLPPGTTLTAVKLDPDGREVARYPGVVIETRTAEPWIGVKATWVSREYDLDGLLFLTGDELHEFFSPDHPFNVFGVFSPEGQLRGWYANVTRPSWLDPSTEPITLFWHDLYIDVVVLPDGKLVVRDEQELEASGLRERDPDLYQTIIRTRDDIIDRARNRDFPFHETNIAVSTQNRR